MGVAEAIKNLNTEGVSEQRVCKTRVVVIHDLSPPSFIRITAINAPQGMTL